MTDGAAVVADPHDLARLIRDVADFPTPGVGFKDITPLLADAAAFHAAIVGLEGLVTEAGLAVDRVVGIESRGFLVGAPLALRLGVGFAPVRKPGKLPGDVEAETYALEYGTDRLEMQRDGVRLGERVLVVDDVIATGGTAAATGRLVTRLGGRVTGFAFLVELAFLDGRRAIASYPTVSLVRYP